MLVFRVSCFFFFNDTATTEIYTLSLHDALPIYLPCLWRHVHLWTLRSAVSQCSEMACSRPDYRHLPDTYPRLSLLQSSHRCAFLHSQCTRARSGDCDLSGLPV